MIQQLEQPTTPRRRLAYSRTLCDNAGNDASRRLADRMIQRWFAEIDRTICGCDCLDEIQIGDTNDDSTGADPTDPE